MSKYFLVLLLILSACAASPIFGDRFKSTIGPGMTTSEVKSAVGKPDGYDKNGDLELYRYTDRMISGFGWDKGNYQVLFKNGKVIKYGMGSIRYRDWAPQPKRTDVYIHE